MWFDSFWHWIKEELLFIIIPFLGSKVKIVSLSSIYNPFHLEFWNNIERSISPNSKIFIKTFTYSFNCISICNSPLRACCFTIGYNNILTFWIFVTKNRKILVIYNTSKVFSCVSEDLPPVTVSIPDLHFVCSSRVSNIPRFIISYRSDCPWFLIKDPFLRIKAIWSFYYHISSNKIKISSTRKSCYNMEFSTNI